MMADMAEIKSVAERVISERFGADARVISISVTEDCNETDEVLRIRVVYETDGKLDAKRIAGMIRHLRSNFHDEIQEDRFPLLSFISRMDAQTEAA